MQHPRFLNYAFILVLASLALPGLAQTITAPAITPPAPTLTISLLSNDLELGDKTQVSVGLMNNSAYDLYDLKLTMAAPDFIQLGDQKPNRKPNQEPAPKPLPGWDTAAGYSSKLKNGIPLHILDTGEVGDFTVLFTLTYKWKTGNQEHQGQVSIEKPLKIGFFGSDKIVGIPLAFAQFIVPGLCFLFILWLFGVAGVKELEGDNKIILSVLISVSCLFIVNFIRKNWHWTWTQKFSADGTISIEKLFSLALSGISLGLLGGIIDISRKRYKAYMRKKLDFTGAETNAGLVFKALKLNSNYLGFAWQFTAKDNTQYICAHYFELDASYILVGSFKVDKEKTTAEEKTKLELHAVKGTLIQTSKHLLAVIEIMGGKDGDKLVTRNKVKKLTATGDPEDFDRFYQMDKNEFRSKNKVKASYMELIAWE